VSIGTRTGEFGKDRELQKWAPSGTDELALGGLDDEKSGAGGGGAGKWDQFTTNERLFGVTTDFDERMYTTEIDRSAPDFKKKEAEALRIAREIEGDTRMVCFEEGFFGCRAEFTY
jgi:PAB1-binding protein PBP1